MKALSANVTMTMIMYAGPVHWERVLKTEAKDYQKLDHN